MLELAIEGLDAVRASFARLVPEVQQRVLRGLAQTAFDTAQTQVDTHTKTGALFRSLTLASDGEGGWLIGHQTQHAPHAVFVHWGTRAHDIPLPSRKDKKVLRWASGQGSETGFVFARHVKHPGYEGDPWLVTAEKEAIRQFDSIVRRAQAQFSTNP